MSQHSPPLPDALTPGVESRPGLLRVLGLGVAIAMVVGNVIGSGIFLKPSSIATAAGDFSMILTAWVVGGVACILGGLCFAELGAMLPRAGGLYVYLREAYGRPVAFLFGWTEFLFGRTASIGALAVVFVLNLGDALGTRFGLVSGVLLSVALVISMAWINLLGAIWGGRVQAGTTLVKAGFLALIGLLPFLLLIFGEYGAEAANYATTLVPRNEAGELLSVSERFSIALLGVLWAYNGWHGVTPVAEEIHDPARNIPRALFCGIGILIALYLLATCAYHGVLSMEEVSQAGNYTAQNMIRKLGSGPGIGWGEYGATAISAVIMCSALGTINTSMLNGPRISFAMGRDDVFFRGLARVHANYRTPAVAILVQAVMSTAILVGTASYVAFPAAMKATGGEMRSISGMGEIFGLLTNFIVFSASIFYMLAVIAVIVLRYRRPEWERPYRTLGYPFVPLAYIGFYGWFLFYVFQGKPLEAIVGLAITAAGLPAYFIYRAWARRHPEDTSDGM